MQMIKKISYVDGKVNIDCYTKELDRNQKNEGKLDALQSFQEVTV